MAIAGRQGPAYLRPEDGPQVVHLKWPDYLDWLAGKKRRAETAWGESVKLGEPWEPGQHMALIGPTGEGKTTHALGVLGLRKYVMALDAKGQDETLSKSGYKRVQAVPPELPWYAGARRLAWNTSEAGKQWREIWDDIADGKHARLIVGGPADNDRQVAALRQLCLEAVGLCRSGGWTFYVDEFEIVSSQELMNLRAAINEMLIAARHKKTSVLTSYQAQAWVSKHSIRQSRRAVLWSTGDRKLIQNVAEGMGRNWYHVAEAVDQLPKFHTVTIPRGRRGGPMVVTHAPPV